MARSIWRGVFAATIAFSCVGSAHAAWKFTKEVDRFTDETTASISPTIPEDLIREGIVGAPVFPSVLCEGTSLRVMFMTTPLAGDANKRVLLDYRVDKNPAVTSLRVELYSGPNPFHLFYLPEELTETFVNEAKRGNVLAIRVTDPADGRTRVVSFRLGGFSSAFAKLNGCSAS